MDWKLWLKGLLSAVIGGATSGAATMLTGTELDGKQILSVAATAGIVSAVMYLKQSPLP